MNISHNAKYMILSYTPVGALLRKYHNYYWEDTYTPQSRVYGASRMSIVEQVSPKRKVSRGTASFSMP